MGLPRDQFGPFFGVKGADIDSASAQITSPIHHVVSTVSLTTLTPPVGSVGGFLGPVRLVADSVFAWTTSGNFGTIQGTTVSVGYAYSFIYDKTTGKWYPEGACNV